MLSKVSLLFTDLDQGQVQVGIQLFPATKHYFLSQEILLQEIIVSYLLLITNSINDSQALSSLVKKFPITRRIFLVRHKDFEENKYSLSTTNISCHNE